MQSIMITKRCSMLGLVCRRFQQHNAKTIQEKATNITHLCKYLNLNENEAQYLTMKHPVVAKLNEDRIQSLMNTLHEIGYTPEMLIKTPALFGILPVTIKHRFKVLRECGIEYISPNLLAAYLTVMRQSSIADLKRSRKIPEHINIENRLASYMTRWPTSLTTLIYEDTDKSTLFALRLKIIQRYLELVLDLTEEEFCRGIATYPTVKHRPLEYINRSLTILQSQIAIPNHKIKSNLYLLHADPDNLTNIISEFRNIGGIDIKEVIRLHPKLAVKNYQSLLEIRKVLDEYNINSDAQRRCFDIYTLSPDTVRARLEKAKRIPEFSMFYNHPRFLKMIHYNKTAMKRLTTLYENNKKCHSLNILSGSSAHYEVYEKAPGDRLGKGKDLLFCISQSLKRKFKVAQIGNVIRRHPFWINTPVLQVKHVYEQLSAQFSDEEIYENCTILLYPWKKIQDALNMLNSEKLYKQFSVFHDNFNFDNLSNSQKLSLILYTLEKKHYFSGNGIWAEERKWNSERAQLHQLNLTLQSTIT